MNPPVDPATLIPPFDQHGLPAPVWVLVVLLNLTLVLHFIAMGYVFGMTLLHVPLAAARRGTAGAWMLRRTERPLPVALSFTIILGAAPLLFAQALYPRMFYTANRLTGHHWLSIIFILMAAFYFIYVARGGKVSGRMLPPALHVAARLAIFATVGYVMLMETTNALIAMKPESWQAIRENGGHFPALAPGLLWPRLAHNALAGIVIGGVWMVALGVRSERLEHEPQARVGATHLRKAGGLFVGLGSGAQVAVGTLMILLAEPEVRTLAFTARPASILWMASLLGVLALLVLGFLALAQGGNWLPKPMWGALALVLSGMFSMRETARETRLSPYFPIHDWNAPWQFSSMTLLLALFVVALGVAGLMANRLIRGWRGEA